MRIELYKTTLKRDIYLGFIEKDNIPSKGDIIYYLGHDYKVTNVEQGSILNAAWVKLIN